MCKKGDLTWMPELGNYGRFIDSCMVEEIRDLNAGRRLVPCAEGNCETLACCCGHGKYPKTVVVRVDGCDKLYETGSKEFIPRKRDFYRLDSEGYYYIPEAKEEWNIEDFLEE